MMRLGAVLAAVLLVLLVLESGCSFFFVRSPLNPQSEQGQPPRTVVEQKNDCTESVAAPALDVLAAVVTAFLGVFAFEFYVNPPPDNRPEDRSGGFLAAGIVLTAATALLIGSAVYGFNTTSQCRALGPVPLPQKAPPVASGSLQACVQKGDAPLRCSQHVPITTLR